MKQNYPQRYTIGIFSFLFQNTRKKVTCSGILILFFLLNSLSVFSQADGDYRTRVAGGSFTATYSGTGTNSIPWDVYSATTGAWTQATVPPSSATNVTIRDGHFITSNAAITVASITVGEGNGAIATATLTGDAVTAVNIVNPGQLVAIPTPLFLGSATTVAIASVSSVNVTGISINNPGSGYTTATVTFAAAPSGGTTATGTATITGGQITGITITDPGSGYTSVPAITITGDGTGAIATSKIGIQAINVTNGGAGYTAAPTVVLGTYFTPGNATNGRTITVTGDVTFKSGAWLVTGNGTAGVAETLNIGGNLSAVTPISFFTVPAANASTTVNFTKAGTATISGTGAITFRNITVAAATTLAVNSATNIAGTVGINTTGRIDASNGSISYVTYTPTPVAQTIANNTFLNGLVKDLTINNTSGVTLNQNISITNLLTMQAGLLTIPATGTLQLSGVNAVAGAFGSASYINTASDAITGAMGMVQINNISAARLYPLGNGGNYLPVSLNPSSNSTFSASVFTGTTDNGTPNGTATANKTNIVDAIYTVNRTSGTGNCQLTLGFPAALKGSGFSSISNYQLGLSRFNGAAWETPVGNGDNTQNFATGAFSSFSPFRVAVNLNATLPVKFGSINASSLNESQVKISWNSYTETNIDRYVIESSSDGINFNYAGSVKATGATSYQWIDASPFAGTNYYRVKSIDQGTGNVSFSKVITIKLNKIQANLVVYPNPVRGGKINLQLSNVNAGKVSIKIYNNLGQSIISKSLNYNGGVYSEIIELPLSAGSGIYHLVMNDGIKTIQKTLHTIP